MPLRRATFHGPDVTYRADTCAPLRKAAADGRVKLWAYGRDSYPGKPLAPGVLPHLQSVGLWNASTDQNWGLDYHRNEGIEFSQLLGGRVPYTCEQDDYDLTTGSLAITRPWQPHRIGRPNIPASNLCWFIVDVGVRRPNQEWKWPAWLPLHAGERDRLTHLLRQTSAPVWRSNTSITQAVNRIARALRGELSQPLTRIALSISEILVELTDLIERENPTLDPYLTSTERTVELFLTNLRERLHEPWTLDRMARECGLGKTRLVHHCRQATNVTPLEYLTNLRLTQATHLLTHTDAKISDIAQQCGFQSSQYFATVYRQHRGQSPGTLRASDGRVRPSV